MDMFEALKLVKEGKAITRQVWSNPGCHVKLVPDPAISPFQLIHIFVPEKNSYNRWIMCSEDLEANDWVETAPVKNQFVKAVTAKPAKGGLLLPARGEMIAFKESSPVPKKK